MTQIAFIGLGHMGNPMARNLLKAGFSLSVYDVMPDAMQRLVTEGAQPSNTPRDAIENADIIFTMLQTGQQVKEVCLGEKGIFAHAKKNTLYIDSSSIDISITRELHHLAASHQLAMLDAPVSGGVGGAEAATLTIMVGGDEKNVERALPILEKLGKKIVYAGPPGNGQAAKICNNLILGISMIAVSEGFTLGQKLGLDPKKFFEISSNASGQCWSMTSYCPVPGIVKNVPANNDYKPGFMAKMMLKDLLLGECAADSVRVTLPLGKAATKLYQRYVEEGHGEIDFSGIINLIATL